MKTIYAFLVAFLATSVSSLAQHQNHTSNQSSFLSGHIFEQTTDSLQALPFANVFWLGTTIGTTSDENGYFELKKVAQTNQLVVSYTGFESDTLTITPTQTHVQVNLVPSELAQVIVEAGFDDVLAHQRETITTQALKKAACCTLSESFETNASVDATTTDAVSGTRQIKMLGLDGIYSQLMIEGMPMMRGLNIRSGLHFIPGTWASSIDINKGAGSVVNGYESITGQINTQLVSPEKKENLLNIYLNPVGRMEGNLNLSHHLNTKWQSATLLHASGTMLENDRNNDGFLDIPKYHIYTALNRWKYTGKKMESQFGVRLLDEHKHGGQLAYKPNESQNNQLAYGVENNTQRIEGWAKLGFFLGENVSFGNQFTGNYHVLNQNWGMRFYEADETYFFYNGILDYTISAKHLLRSGVSYVFNQTKQNYQDLQFENASAYELDRKESIPGIFAEYTFNRDGDFTAVVGARADFHNLYGTQLSPRVHLKWNAGKNTVLRASGGRGFRVANPIVENGTYLASSRILTLGNDLQPEIAWNYGASFVQGFELGKHKGKITLDFYRTNFENQIVLDLETPNELVFDNLDGTSYANSFQAQIEYELLEGLSTTVAYKWYDVRTTIDNQLVQMPFTAAHRFFTNAEYKTKNEKWAFDATLQWIGKQRLPESVYNLSTESPAYFLLNAQITRNFKNLEIYVGGENITDYTQANPILDAQNPFSTSFDASRVYAPIIGAMGYAGLRFYF